MTPTPFTNEDVARIADGLSGAMGLALRWFPQDGSEIDWLAPYNDRPHQRSIMALIDRGLVDGATGLNGFVKGSLTLLGNAVRAYLEQSNG